MLFLRFINFTKLAIKYMIKESTLEFLKNLEENNTKEWFEMNRKWYETSKSNFVDFCSLILNEMKQFEPDFSNTNIKDCIFRINRDIRFSKDKSPYKNHFSAAFGPGGRNSGKIDYYIQLQNGKTSIGGGMWQPSVANLAKFRQEIDYSPETLKNIIESKEFRKHFPEIYGEKLKKAPKGYDPEHPEAELLKYKELFFFKTFTNDEVFSENFQEIILNHFKILKPYIDYVNELFFGETD